MEVVIEYIPETHQYLVDGILALSVTQIIDKLFPSDYANIPQYILDKACDYGIQVHEAIENYEKGITEELPPLIEETLESYIDIACNYEIDVIDMEQIVHYEDKYCGRYDMLANVKGELSIIDVKTTSQLHEERLKWQLGMYKTAIERYSNMKIAKAYCLWLPKKKAPKFVKIMPKTKEEIEVMLDEIEAE